MRVLQKTYEPPAPSGLSLQMIRNRELTALLERIPDNPSAAASSRQAEMARTRSSPGGAGLFGSDVRSAAQSAEEPELAAEIAQIETVVAQNYFHRFYEPTCVDRSTGGGAAHDAWLVRKRALLHYYGRVAAFDPVEDTRFTARNLLRATLNELDLQAKGFFAVLQPFAHLVVTHAVPTLPPSDDILPAVVVLGCALHAECRLSKALAAAFAQVLELKSVYSDASSALVSSSVTDPTTSRDISVQFRKEAFSTTPRRHNMHGPSRGGTSRAGLSRSRSSRTEHDATTTSGITTSNGTTDRLQKAHSSPAASSEKSSAPEVRLLILLRTVSFTLCNLIFGANAATSRSGTGTTTEGATTSSSSAGAGPNNYNRFSTLADRAHWPVFAASLLAQCFKTVKVVFPSNGKDDNSNELAQLLVRCFGAYQQAKLQPSMLHILLEIGATDPGLLVSIMGKCARRVDLKEGSYASNALFVLCQFLSYDPQSTYTVLPLLVEAVLRCLDPADPNLRKVMLLSATQTLHQMVTQLPMCCFHQATQRYGVGTREGRVFVYDLRTATKYRVLDLPGAPQGNNRVLACSFAEDGAKLAAYAADASLTVWSLQATGLLDYFRRDAAKAAGRSRVIGTPTGADLATALAKVQLVWRTHDVIQVRRENDESLTISVADLFPI
ncbi:unnamed protein product [Amoebophrya sp. A120]|nr:unnamed protein product [Amoebophrya sp. A120]|eukprot:GSA120T00021651001.1